MQVNRRTAAGRNGVAAGSVWESRMKIDEVKGGIKVFNGRENPQEEEKEEDDKGSGLKRTKTHVVGRNRRTWKSEIEGDPVQLRKSRSELLKKLAQDFDKDKNFKGSLRRTALSNGNGDGDEDEENAEDEEMEMEKEEIESIDIKEMNSAEEKLRTVEEKKEKIHQIHEIPISVSPRVEEKIHEQPISPFKQRSSSNKEKLQQIQAKPSRIHESPTSPYKHWNVAERDKLNQILEIPNSPFRRRNEEEKDKFLQIHEIPISPFNQRSVEKEKLQSIHEIPEYVEKQRSLAEKQKLYQFHEITTSSDEEIKSPPLIDHPSVDPDLRKPPPSERFSC